MEFYGEDKGHKYYTIFNRRFWKTKTMPNYKMIRVKHFVLSEVADYANETTYPKYTGEAHKEQIKAIREHLKATLSEFKKHIEEN